MLPSLMGLRPAEVCGPRVGRRHRPGRPDPDGGEHTHDLVVAGGEWRSRSRRRPRRGTGHWHYRRFVVAALKQFKTTQARERLAASEAYQASGTSWPNCSAE